MAEGRTGVSRFRGLPSAPPLLPTRGRGLGLWVFAPGWWWWGAGGPQGGGREVLGVP